MTCREKAAARNIIWCSGPLAFRGLLVWAVCAGCYLRSRPLSPTGYAGGAFCVARLWNRCLGCALQTIDESALVFSREFSPNMRIRRNLPIRAPEAMLGNRRISTFLLGDYPQKCAVTQNSHTSNGRKPADCRIREVLPETVREDDVSVTPPVSAFAISRCRRLGMMPVAIPQSAPGLPKSQFLAPAA